MAAARCLSTLRRFTRLYSNSSTGLFGRQVLSSPEGFQQLTTTTLSEAKLIVDKILLSSSSQDTVDLFDELSNTLCRTADLAECIRLLHPNTGYVDQARDCCLEVSSYVEKLNTDKELYDSLKKIINQGEEYDTLERDTKRNIASLLHDFEISGIHLSKGDRERVVALNEFILSRNHAFLSNCNSPSYVQKELLPHEFSKYFTTDGAGHVVIDHTPLVSNDEIRELSYKVYYSVSTQQNHLLNELLLAKYELASLVGYESFAHRTLKDSMAGSPEVVLEFLNALSAKLLPLAKEEAKEALSLVDSKSQVLPWDVPWLTHLAKQRYLNALISPRNDMKQYFPLDSCIEGVDSLFRSLFGVNLLEEQLHKGEGWDSSVRKFSFVDEASSAELGKLYCDFYYRANKLNSDCQFTIQGCRKLPNGDYQMPISTLNLSLPEQSSPYLSQLAVENLFHEMGHAAHSVIGRTRYQNLSGTRCPTDFAEVPSNLMELFLHSSQVLKSFARSSGARLSDNSNSMVIPDEVIAAFQVTGNVFPALSAQTQILMSVLDQIFHSSRPLDQSCVDVYANLHQSYSPIAYVPGTASFLRFAHLTTYAGKYYSYLWARAVANLIWIRCFKKDPFSSTAGRLYKDRMLAFGGGEDPNVLVKNLLGYQPSINELVDSYYQEIIQLKSKITSVK